MSQKSPEPSLDDKDNDTLMNGTVKNSPKPDELMDTDTDEIPRSAKNTSSEKDEKTDSDSLTTKKAKKVRRSSRSRSRCSSSDLKSDKIEEPTSTLDDAKTDKAKINDSKKDAPKTDEAKKDETKKDENKRDENKKDENKKVENKKNENQEEEVGDMSDEDPDFLGFEPNEPCLADEHAKFLKKKMMHSEDDVASQEALSEHMSTDNPPSVDSDSNMLNDPTAHGGKRSLRSTKKSIQVDITNPEFKKPFDHGWVRELVYRNPQEGTYVAGRRNADVYYFSPNGKKVRSCREVAEYLAEHPSDLTPDNFSFFKEPIGINDPTKEIIREAKVKVSTPKITEDGANVKKTPTTKTKPIKIPKPTPEASSKIAMPRVVFPKTNSLNKRNLNNKNKLDKKRKSTGPDDMDIMSDNDWSPEQKHPTRDVCSIDCRLAMGLIPSLQCNTCLCLYHPECMGFPRDKLRQSNPYTCRNCQVVKPPSTALLPPPPPTSTKPPSPIKKDLKVISVTRPQPIVGALTTWLPPSSSIQVSQNSLSPKTSTVSIAGTTSTTSAGSLNPTAAEAFNPQSIVTIEGSQFVMIHKRNVVNVSDQNNHSPTPGNTTEPVANLISTAPGTYVASSQPQIGKPPLILVPYQIPTPDPNDSQLQIPVVNSSIQGITPVAVQPGGSFQNGVKRIAMADASSPPPEKRFKMRDFPVENPSVYLRENFMMNLNAGFTALLHAFQYLKVHELLRAVCVSQMWRHIASHKSLWETVRMKNSRVRDWEGFGKALLHHGTKTLDLRKMLLPEIPDQMSTMWLELSQAVSGLPQLKKIDFGRCTSQAIETVAAACPQLESIISLSIRGNELDLTNIANCKNLVELRLKNVIGMDIKNLAALKKMKNLKVLALTTVKNIDDITDGLSDTIENLELGDSIKLSETFATETLPTLVNLKRLRLEKGQGNCPTIALLNSIANLPNLTQLELINFDVKPGFEKALAKCSNIKTLLIIPTYITQSATTNHVVMGGVSKLNQTLTYFIWGLTLELLRVTDLFIDQVEGHKGKSQTPGGKKPGAGDSIPILKPIGEGGELKEGPGASQVDILGLPKLQKVLSTLLPTTKIKILKVPFSATWRQTVTDGPNQ